MPKKIVGTSGKYGPRYGTRTKKIVNAIEKLQKQRQPCPYCERTALERLAAGIWHCTKCNKKFAGGAYFPKSAITTEVIGTVKEVKSEVAGAKPEKAAGKESL